MNWNELDFRGASAALSTPSNEVQHDISQSFFELLGTSSLDGHTFSNMLEYPMPQQVQQENLATAGQPSVPPEPRSNVVLPRSSPRSEGTCNNLQPMSLIRPVTPETPDFERGVTESETRSETDEDTEGTLQYLHQFALLLFAYVGSTLTFL